MSNVTMSDIVKGEHGSVYSLFWDGWRAYLTLRRDGTGYLSFPHDPRNTFGVRAQLLKDTMAGVTWWNGIPFGFYAKYEGNVIG